MKFFFSVVNIMVNSLEYDYHKMLYKKFNNKGNYRFFHILDEADNITKKPKPKFILSNKMTKRQEILIDKYNDLLESIAKKKAKKYFYADKDYWSKLPKKLRGNDLTYNDNIMCKVNSIFSNHAKKRLKERKIDINSQNTVIKYVPNTYNSVIATVFSKNKYNNKKKEIKYKKNINNGVYSKKYKKYFNII